MTTDTTHITKEGLLQAIKEEYPNVSVTIHGKIRILARAAELSAQESKPVAWEITMTADDPYPPIIKLRRPDGVGMVLTKGDFVYPYFAELAAPSLSAQDASPKDGWQIEIVPDPPYPPIVRVRSPEGVARVLTEGDGVLYRYFHKVALAALEVPK